MTCCKSHSIQNKKTQIDDKSAKYFIASQRKLADCLGIAIPKSVGRHVSKSGPQWNMSICVSSSWVWSVQWTPGLRQANKTLFAVRCKILDGQSESIACCPPVGEAEAGSAAEQPAKE